MKPRRIAFIGFDDVNALDLVGPIEAFASAFIERGSDKATPGYAISILGLTGRTFRAESGIVFKPHRSLKGQMDIDTLIIPGGRGLRVPRVNSRVAAWIRVNSPQIRRIASVCTGIYALAATGLLDGRRVTTHWGFVRDVAQKFPRLSVDPDALYVKDGSYYTSAGVTAGIDLALALVEEDYGSEVALRAAREMVVYLKRSGGQEQYSEPLRFQIEATDPIAAIGVWIRSHLRQNLSVDALAQRASLSPRQFNRRFILAFKQTPAVFVEDLRLSEARQRLTTTKTSIDGVAASVGFASADSFRRAFERRFSIPPTIYRRRFAGQGKTEA
ncbi:MAG: DJ-1/PfpI family protein [Vicinamibacteria bacterium]